MVDVERKDVNIEVNEESQSDDDYWFMLVNFITYCYYFKLIVKKWNLKEVYLTWPNFSFSESIVQ